MKVHAASTKARCRKPIRTNAQFLHKPRTQPRKGGPQNQSPGMRGHPRISKIGVQPIGAKHLATCALTSHRWAREDSRARPGHTCTITVPLWSHSRREQSASEREKGEAQKRASASRSDNDKGRVVAAGATGGNGGHGVLRGAPRRRAPPRRPARLRPPPAPHRLPASPRYVVSDLICAAAVFQGHWRWFALAILLCRCAEAVPAPREGRLRGHLGIRWRAHRGPQSQGTTCVYLLKWTPQLPTGACCVIHHERGNVLDVALTHRAVGRHRGQANRPLVRRRRRRRPLAHVRGRRRHQRSAAGTSS